MTKSTPGPPAARQFGAAMLATLAVLFLIVACPSSSLVVWGVWGWLTFCCGVLATAFFVVRAVGAATLGGSTSGANFAFFVVVAAACWWPGGGHCAGDLGARGMAAPAGWTRPLLGSASSGPRRRCL